MGGGRGVLAGVVWMNLDMATGRSCQISPVSGSDVLVEGQRAVASASCARLRPFGKVHTQTPRHTRRSGRWTAGENGRSWPAGLICRYQREGTGEIEPHVGALQATPALSGASGPSVRPLRRG